ncbi:MAG: metallophosphoesterase family protein, partial [Chloroflexota bacterium]
MRLLHTADVHLGAPFRILGSRGHEQRRQLVDTFHRIVQLAIDEQVDLMIVAGDLFDGPNPPDSLVNDVADQAGRLAGQGIPLAILPGTHDYAAAGSVFQQVDFAALAPGCIVFDAAHPSVTLGDGELTLHGVFSSTKSVAGNPLASVRLSNAPIQVGVGHGSLEIPGVVESDDVLFRREDVAKSGLRYLALGHWHSFATHRFGETWACYAGAPEFVALDQPGFGAVALVTLGPNGACEIERRQVGRRRYERLSMPVDGIADAGTIARAIEQKVDSDLVLEVTLTGQCEAGLLVDPLALETELGGSFFRLRVRDESGAALADVDPTAFPETTVLGRFARRMAERIAATSEPAERAT